jgi:hypothetical protein
VRFSYLALAQDKKKSRAFYRQMHAVQFMSTVNKKIEDTNNVQSNATVQILQKHNWYISMQCHSPNASETQLVYLNAMPLFKCFRNTTGISQCNATVQMLPMAAMFAKESGLNEQSL